MTSSENNISSMEFIRHLVNQKFEQKCQSLYRDDTDYDECECHECLKPIIDEIKCRLHNIFWSNSSYRKCKKSEVTE